MYRTGPPHHTPHEQSSSADHTSLPYRVAHSASNLVQDFLRPGGYDASSTLAANLQADGKGSQMHAGPSTGAVVGQNGLEGPRRPGMPAHGAGPATLASSSFRSSNGHDGVQNAFMDFRKHSSSLRDAAVNGSEANRDMTRDLGDKLPPHRHDQRQSAWPTIFGKPSARVLSFSPIPSSCPLCSEAASTRPPHHANDFSAMNNIWESQGSGTNVLGDYQKQLEAIDKTNKERLASVLSAREHQNRHRAAAPFEAASRDRRKRIDARSLSQEFLDSAQDPRDMQPNAVQHVQVPHQEPSQQIPLFDGLRSSLNSRRSPHDTPASELVPLAMRTYGISGDPTEYSLGIIDGDKEILMGRDDRPFAIFHQIEKEGRRPVFMLQHHANLKHRGDAQLDPLTWPEDDRTTSCAPSTKMGDGEPSLQAERDAFESYCKYEEDEVDDSQLAAKNDFSLQFNEFPKEPLRHKRLMEAQRQQDASDRLARQEQAEFEAKEKDGEQRKPVRRLRMILDHMPPPTGNYPGSQGTERTTPEERGRAPEAQQASPREERVSRSPSPESWD